MKFNVVERILHRYEPDEWATRLTTDDLAKATDLVKVYRSRPHSGERSWFITVEVE